MDREKVIKALQYCKDNQHVNDCEECDYGGISGMFCYRLIDEAIAMLKEQEKEPKRVMRIIRETIHQAMYESEKDKDFEDFVCELIEHRIYHTNR